MGKIKFSCISRGTVILCNHQNATGNFTVTVNHMLPNIPVQKNGKTTYTSNNYCFHSIVHDGLIYLCSTDSEFRQQQAYLFLEEIKSQFHNRNLVRRAETAGLGDLNSDFKDVLSRQMEEYSDDGKMAMSQLRSQVEDIKDVMTQNVQKVLQRGDKLEDLMDKTDDLEASAGVFQKITKRVRKKYWWRNMRMTLLLGVVVVIVLTVIVVIILTKTGVIKTGDTKPATKTREMKKYHH